MPEGANRPLAGITVLHFGQVYQGPYATLLMAKAGADVIKNRAAVGRAAAPTGKSTTFPIAMELRSHRPRRAQLRHSKDWTS
jgi:crotonobetainyl-CoA:carnitine CoA-transferase CaiB-like acyl-CoA transferase